MEKDRVTNYHITTCLTLLTGCSPNNIDIVTSTGGDKFITTDLMVKVMINPMACYEMSPGACGILQYVEGQVHIIAFAKNVCDLYRLNYFFHRTKR